MCCFCPVESDHCWGTVTVMYFLFLPPPNSFLLQFSHSLHYHVMFGVMGGITCLLVLQQLHLNLIERKAHRDSRLQAGWSKWMKLVLFMAMSTYICLGGLEGGVYYWLPNSHSSFFLSSRTLGYGQAEWFSIGIHLVEMIVFVVIIHILFRSCLFILLFREVMVMKLSKGK